MEYGLTSAGFVIKPFTVIHAEVKDDFLRAFGTDLDVSSTSLAGAFINNFSIKLNQVWELAEGLYAMSDPRSAQGIYLDRLAHMVAVSRMSAVSTRVYVAIWGVPGSLIRAGHRIKTSQEEVFSLVEDVTINPDKAIAFSFSLDQALPNTTYTVTINTVAVRYTTGSNPVINEVNEAFITALQTAFPQYFGYITEEKKVTVYRFDGYTPFSFQSDQTVWTIKVASAGLYTAVKAGATFVASGAVNKVQTNVAGLESVYNFVEGVTGRSPESDSELRHAIQARQAHGSSSSNAIQTALLSLKGVTYVRVYENRTMETVDGRPPKSFEAIVVGGTDLEVADTLLRVRPAGIQMVGNMTVPTVDAGGYPFDVSFSRPTERYIWVWITLSVDKTVYPYNGNELVRQAVLDWAETELTVGSDVMYQHIIGAGYKASGVHYVNVTVAVTSNPSIEPETYAYESANILIADSEIALFNGSRIRITVI
jgi:uncharacterized phage protein gp47/JayE